MRIAIAHRLNTIQNADRIYLLQAGKVIQLGSFTDLANQPGLFAQRHVKTDALATSSRRMLAPVEISKYICKL